MYPVATNITVDVHFRQLHSEGSQDICYRIYINDDLITERTWIWDNKTYLREDLWANLNPKDLHFIRLEPLIQIPEQVKFGLLDFNAVNLPVKVLAIKPHKITFKLV